MKIALEDASARVSYFLLPWTEDLLDLVASGVEQPAVYRGSPAQIVMATFIETLAYEYGSGRAEKWQLCGGGSALRSCHIFNPCRPEMM
jgi:hypothetical protein